MEILQKQKQNPVAKVYLVQAEHYSLSRRD
jgi:hypothetical protein